MSLKSGLLITGVIFCFLGSSVSALVIDYNLKLFTLPTNIENLEGGFLEVVDGGRVVALDRLNINRVNSSTPGRLIMNGGSMVTIADFMFPDDYGPVEMWVNSGTFTAKKIQNLGGRPSERPVITPARFMSAAES